MTDGTKVNLDEKLQKILDAVSGLTVLELAELVKAMEEKFGVSATAPAVAVATAPAASSGEEAEEKSSFNVVLENAGDNKISVIKVVKELTGLGLTEAKAFVESAPKNVKEGVSREEAEQMVAKLKEAGAVASMK